MIRIIGVWTIWVQIHEDELVLCPRLAVVVACALVGGGSGGGDCLAWTERWAASLC